MTYEEFAEQYRIHLNAQQRQAVEQTEGATLLLAVPGSGKTTTLVTRLGYLIYVRGVRPENILTMTYTVVASRDMRQRFAGIFGEEMAGRLAFRTINGVCASIIHRYLTEQGRDGFALLEDNSAMLRQIYRERFRDYPEDSELRDWQTELTYCKNMLLSVEEIAQRKVADREVLPLWTAYRERLRREGLMDYDDQMIYARSILLKYPRLLARLQEQYPYLCVDEAQDTSRIQHELIRMLAGDTPRLFMVGDEDQSIYGFRAAYPRALLEFEQNYPGSRVLFLEENYRSSGEIVDAANRLIGKNHDRREKQMFTQREAGEPLQFVSLLRREAQYAWIVNWVRRQSEQELAVLYRNNDSAVALMDHLQREGIAFRCRNGESSFFSSRAVNALRDYITLAYEPTQTKVFLRVYYKLGLGIKREAAEAAVERFVQGRASSCMAALAMSPELPDWMQERLWELEGEFQLLKEDSARQAVARIQYRMGLGGYLLQNGGDTERLFLLSVLAEREETALSLLQRLDDLKCLSESGGSRESRLILSTIHSSKGLEYQQVLVMDAVDGILPTVTPSPYLDQEQRETLEEERRLFYVAVTRARDRLLLLQYERQGEGQFLKELKKPKQAIPYSPPERPKLKDYLAGRKRSTPHEPPERPNLKDYCAGRKIRHVRFGVGQIRSVNNDIATIDFARGMEKQLYLPFCVLQGLMQLLDE